MLEKEEHIKNQSMQKERNNKNKSSSHIDIEYRKTVEIIDHSSHRYRIQKNNRVNNSQIWFTGRKKINKKIIYFQLNYSEKKEKTHYQYQKLNIPQTLNK